MNKKISVLLKVFTGILVFLAIVFQDMDRKLFLSLMVLGLTGILLFALIPRLHLPKHHLRRIHYAQLSCANSAIGLRTNFVPLIPRHYGIGKNVRILIKSFPVNRFGSIYAMPQSLRMRR